LILAAAMAQSERLQDALGVLTGADGAPAAGPHSVPIVAALGGAVELGVEDAALADALATDIAVLGRYAYAVACMEAGLHNAALEGLRALPDALTTNPAILTMMFEAMAHAVPAPEREAAARQLVADHPAETDAWLGLDRVFESLGDLEGRQEALSKAIELAPDQPRVWRRQALFFDAQEDFDQAVAAYRRLLELMPNDVVAANNLAYALLMSGGNLDEALAQARSAVEQRPANPSFLHTLGLVLLRKGELEQSHRNLKLAVELRPGNPTFLLDFGQVLVARGDVAEGKESIQLALQYADQLGLEFARRTEAEEVVKTL